VKGFDKMMKHSLALGNMRVCERVTDSELATCMEEFGRKLIQSSQIFCQLDETGKRAFLAELQPYADELRKMFFRRRNGIP